MNKKTVKKQGENFTKEDDHAIIQEMISNRCAQKEILKKYTGQELELRQLLKYMEKMSYPIKTLLIA
jgi:hypothetical protein